MKASKKLAVRPKKLGPESTEARAKRLTKDGYSSELLANCIVSQRMRMAGHAWSVIAVHFGVSTHAARTMAAVGGTSPADRLNVAAKLNLLRVVKDGKSCD